MNADTNGPRRSRPAPEPDYSGSVHEIKPREPARNVQQSNIVEAGKERETPSVRADDSPRCVVVTDIHMAFGSMVIFLVKLAFAAIPAMVIVAMIVITAVAVIGPFLR